MGTVYDKGWKLRDQVLKGLTRTGMEERFLSRLHSVVFGGHPLSIVAHWAGW